MFIQLIQGKVRDEAALRRSMDRWESDVMPGAVGFLGTTAGTCDDGTFVALARFESADAARRNSERPEQSAWWAETAKCFAGEVTFMDCPEVHQWLDGGSDTAGFVQVMEGQSPDVTRMRELMERAGARVHEARPEIIGGMFGETPDGHYVEAVYFTSEREAREHEAMEIPADLKAVFDEEMRLMGEVSYFDLHRPILLSASR